jgi:hypothetical protein
LFSSLDESVQTKVTLGTYIQVIILGKQSIHILTYKEEQKVMFYVYYVSGLKHNLMSIGKLLQKGYIIYMEDNHRVIMDKFPSNQLIEKIQMTGNKMFPLTLKPIKKKNTTQSTGKKESAHNFNEENSACNTNKGENGAEMNVSFQSKIQDDSWLWNFIFGHLNF